MDTTNLKQDLVTTMLDAGAYDVRIADPRKGFEHAHPDRHPRTLMPACRSVVVFALATSPEMNNTYVGSYSPNRQGNRMRGPLPSECRSDTHAMNRLSRLFQDMLYFVGSSFLYERGFQYQCLGGIQMKVAAHEAGIGTWGKAGFILHPELGNRISLGAIMTDAELSADTKREVHFCDTCNRCHQICPAQAYGEIDQYHGNWDRETCVTKRAEIAEKGYYCHNCFAGCPSSPLEDTAFLETKKTVSWWKRGTSS